MPFCDATEGGTDIAYGVPGERLRQFVRGRRLETGQVRLQLRRGHPEGSLGQRRVALLQAAFQFRDRGIEEMQLQRNRQGGGTRPVVITLLA